MKYFDWKYLLKSKSKAMHWEEEKNATQRKTDGKQCKAMGKNVNRSTYRHKMDGLFVVVLLTPKVLNTNLV